MKAFDDPGLAIGIVTGDKLVYAKGSACGRKGGEPVDTRHGLPDRLDHQGLPRHDDGHRAWTKKFAWDDRVVDLYPDFQMKDPWVTQEFRLFDLLAQRSGLPPYANDFVGLLGADQPAMIRSLRYVEPVSSFRSTFAYTNITHMRREHIVAKAARRGGLGRGGQRHLRSARHEGVLLHRRGDRGRGQHARGHRWTPDGTVEVPFTPIFPTSSAAPARSTPRWTTWCPGCSCS